MLYKALGAYILSILIAAIGTLVFFHSFFPPKAGYALQAGVVDEDKNYQNPKRNFRTIIMLVDALRADFIFRNESEFSFVSSRIKDGTAIPFITRADPPTVTLPRIKSMITGTIPGFMDVAANFNSQELF